MPPPPPRQPSATTFFPVPRASSSILWPVLLGSTRSLSDRVPSPWLASSCRLLSPLVSARLGSPRLASFLRLVEKSSVVNGNSGFIVPLQTMPGNIIKTFRRNILMLTHRFTVRQTFRSSKLLRLCVCLRFSLSPTLASGPSLFLFPARFLSTLPSRVHRSPSLLPSSSPSSSLASLYVRSISRL